MAPSTRLTSRSNNGDDGVTRQYVDDAMAEIKQTLAAMNNTLTTFRDDVRGWVFRCDQFFLIDNTSPEEKVKIVPVHLFDKALLWHRQFVKTMGDNVGCDEYKEAIIQIFGSIFKDPMAALKNAKYEKNAKEFQDLFDTLQSTVDVSEDHALKATLEAMKKKNRSLISNNSGRFGYGSGSGNVSKPPLLALSSTGNNVKSNLTQLIRHQLEDS
ncbi:hypothetical protein Tco_0827062 [Tanacetum coccineum]